MSASWSKRLLRLESVANVATILTCGVVIWVLLGPRPNPAAGPARRAEAPLPKEPIEVHRFPSLGRSDAKAVMVVFSDFECPYCKRFALETFPMIRSEYVESGKLRVVFRHLPIEQIHKHARTAAVGSLCAHEQGRFWEFHDLLFDRERLTDSAVLESAAKLKLDGGVFRRCLGGVNAGKAVDADLALSRALEISSTPAFLFGVIGADGRAIIKKRLTGAQRLGEFRGVIEGVAAFDPPEKK